MSTTIYRSPEDLFRVHVHLHPEVRAFIEQREGVIEELEIDLANAEGTIDSLYDDLDAAEREVFALQDEIEDLAADPADDHSAGEGY